MYRALLILSLFSLSGRAEVAPQLCPQTLNQLRPTNTCDLKTSGDLGNLQKCSTEVFWKVCSGKFQKYFATANATDLLFSDFNKKLQFMNEAEISENVQKSLPWLDAQGIQRLSQISDPKKRKLEFDRELLKESQNPLSWGSEVFCQEHSKCSPLAISEASCGSAAALQKVAEHNNCVLLERVASRSLAKSVDVKKALEADDILGDHPSKEEIDSGKLAIATFCKEDFSLGGILRAGAGAAASFATHELSHEVAGRVLGNPLTWNKDDVTWNCPYPCPSIKPIAMVGLLSHNVSSEVIVQKNDQDSMFQKGWLIFNVANTSSYVIRDWLNRKKGVGGYGGKVSSTGKNGYGDLQALSNKESYVVGSLMMGHQLFSAYRYYQNSKDRKCKTE